MFIYPVIKITLSVAPNYVAREASSVAEELGTLCRRLEGVINLRDERKGKREKETGQRGQIRKKLWNELIFKYICDHVASSLSSRLITPFVLYL